ncbi:MAG TPA: hypothetical protein VMU43_08425 [Candidatus Acidoferrum sp.]|nr:hypothetical protein [Candidatus Acidoferrum sp.]
MIRKARAAKLSETEHEFNPFEAAKPQVTLQVGFDAAGRKFVQAAATVQLFQELLNAGQCLLLSKTSAVELCPG